MADRELDFTEFEGLASQVLATGSALRFQVRGTSMSPFIRNGDIVAISPGNLRPGQVILCRLSGGRLVVHRVVKVLLDVLQVQGDALLYSDGLVGFSSVLGRVTSINRGSNQISLDSFAYNLFIRLWLWLTPVRRYLFRVIRLFRTIFRLFA